MAPRPESTPESLLGLLGTIFDQAQSSVANHRKNCVALYKIHVKATITIPADKSKKNTTAMDQSEFVEVFLDMVSRILGVKKGSATAERTVKFVAAYVQFINEKDLEEKAKRQPSIPSNSISSGGIEDDDTLASMFVASVLEWVTRGFVAKNKIVRYQTVHLVAEMILYLGEIDEDSYLSLRESLIERSTCDKEPSIRVQAVAALARLVGSEDPGELQHGEKSILEVLLDVMCHDPSADVRRAALVHVPLTVVTLPIILTRTRDIDPLTRKLVYASVLQLRLGHPQHLTITQREEIVQTGLGDREPAVRLAAGKMVATWFDTVFADGSRPEHEVTWVGDDGGIMAAMISFLMLFDVVGPGEVIAVDALLSLLTTRPDLFDVFVFSDEYWKQLTPESVVLARVFLEQCLTAEREDRLESASLPVVTAFAFHIQEAYNSLLAVLDDAEVQKALSGDEEVADDMEEELAKKEIILGELLRMAVKLDYMDEIGRRKVYTVTRDMLAHPQLPPSLIERCIDVLKEIMPSERELIRVVVEVIMELREYGDPDMNEAQNDVTQSDVTQSTIPKERSFRWSKERHEMSVEEGIQADLIDLRCLTLCIAMLERVHGNFEDNSTLEGILADLIIPAVRRKELGIREKGLVGLGLCCLIAKSIAVKSLQLFLSQIQNAPEQLKFKLLQVVFDLMIMYDQQLWSRAEDGQAILTFLSDTLEAEESPMVQAVLCVGLSKLLLSGLADDPKILKSLLLAYVSPRTAGNSELRQCLSYFFSVYCYSSVENQSRLQSIFMVAFDEVSRMQDELDEDQTMVSSHQFGLLVIDWTGSQKVSETARTPSHSRQVHADLAVDILLALYDSDRRSEDQEVLCTFLSHLHIESTLEPQLLVKLSILLEHIDTQCPFDDAALDKTLRRFKSSFATSFAADLEQLNYEGYLTDEIREMYDFIGIDIPKYTNPPGDVQEDQDDSQDVSAGTPPSSPITAKVQSPANKARSKASPPPSPSPVPIKSKRGKPSRSKASPPQTEESDSDEEDEAPPAMAPVKKVRSKASPPPSPSPVPIKSKRGKPSRSKASPPQTEESDSDEEDEAPPAMAPVKKARPEASPPPSPSPVPIKSKRGKPSRAKASPPQTEDSNSDEEDEAPPAIPATPLRPGVKRNRAAAVSALPSPADKKRSRLKSPRKTGRAGAPSVAAGTRRSARQTSRTVGKPEAKSSQDAVPGLDVESDDDAGSDDFGGYSES